MRQLALVGDDGQIRLQDLDLGSEVRIPPHTASGPADADFVANWPTWSPTGDRVAFFQYALANAEVRAASLCVATADGSRVADVYRTTGDGLICMAWAPDGRRIAVLVQEANRLYLRVVDSSGEQPPITVAQGAPVYFAWQPDSRGLVVHVGVEGLVAGETRILWVRLEGGSSSSVPFRGAPAPGFRAPAWSHRLNGATVAFDGDDEAVIAVQGGPQEEPDVLAHSRLAPAFAWNAEGSALAFADRTTETPGPYSGISVYQLEDRGVRKLTDEPTLTFFWCPDGRRIVCTSGEVGNRLVRLQIVEVASGRQSDLGWVRPSRDMLLLFGHFDQYAQSLSLVSPDGKELALAASIAQEQTNGSVPTVREVIVRSLEGEPADRIVTRGRLAFWRPGG